MFKSFSIKCGIVLSIEVQLNSVRLNSSISWIGIVLFILLHWSKNKYINTYINICSQAIFFEKEHLQNLQHLDLAMNCVASKTAFLHAATDLSQEADICRFQQQTRLGVCITVSVQIKSGTNHTEIFKGDWSHWMEVWLPWSWTYGGCKEKLQKTISASAFLNRTSFPMGHSLTILHIWEILFSITTHWISSSRVIWMSWSASDRRENSITSFSGRKQVKRK